MYFGGLVCVFLEGWGMIVSCGWVLLWVLFCWGGGVYVGVNIVVIGVVWLFGIGWVVIGLLRYVFFVVCWMWIFVWRVVVCEVVSELEVEGEFYKEGGE